MKRCLPFAVALALPMVAYSQGTTTATVGVAVQADATLTRTGTTSFGIVGNTARTVTIDPMRPAPDQSTAQFIATGAPNANIVLTFDAGVALCHETAGCNQRIPFTPTVGAADVDIQDPGFGGPITSGTVRRLNAQGKTFFWLGGSIQVSAEQPAGSYSGVFTMTALYQ